MIDAAIFDMDGLLFDTERLCSTVWAEVAASAGFFMSDELFRSCVGRNSQDTRQIVLASCGPDFPFEDFSGTARLRMMSIMENSGPPLKDGARELLEFLKETGIPAALATSTSAESALRMIEWAGFSDFFQAKAFGSEVACGKPAPDIFLLAGSRLAAAHQRNLLPENTVVLEDSPAGIRGAHAAGMKPVLIPDLIYPEPAVRQLVWREFSSLSDVLADFKKM